ncbi:hypothetical protein [Devosia sp.]|uniref:hypothetical protein n=1 Tax=Devosia sp. TaxID=1871048 RepID=UPI002FCB099A
MTLLSALWSRIGGYVAAAGALVAILFGAWLKGGREAKQKAKLEDITNANEIRKAGADARAGVDAGRLRDSDGWRRD